MMTHGGFPKVKDYIWDVKIPKYFNFPTKYDRELVKKKQKKSWGHASRISRGHYTRILSCKIKCQISMVDSLASRTSGRISRNIGYPRST